MRFSSRVLLPAALACLLFPSASQAAISITEAEVVDGVLRIVGLAPPGKVISFQQTGLTRTVNAQGKFAFILTVLPSPAADDCRIRLSYIGPTTVKDVLIAGCGPKGPAGPRGF